MTGRPCVEGILKVFYVLIICIDPFLADVGGGGFVEEAVVTREVGTVVGSKAGTIGRSFTDQMVSIKGAEEILSMLVNTVSNCTKKTVTVAIHVIFTYPTDGDEGGVVDVGICNLALDDSGQNTGGWHKGATRYVRVRRICVVYDDVVDKEVARLPSG
jgi:hypothetical protein